jgi:hypothetical protein
MLVSAAARLTMPSAHDRGGLLFPTDLEIAQRALRLRAPIFGGIDLDGAKGVGFSSGGFLAGIGHVAGLLYGEFARDLSRVKRQNHQTGG